MKKNITSLLLALTLCLGLLPAAHATILIDGWTDGGSGGDLGTVSAEEAAREYGISLSVDRVDFGSCFKGDELEPLTVTLTNNSDHTLSCSWGPSKDDDLFRFSRDPSGDLEPGASAEVSISLRTWRATSGPATVELWLTLDPRPWAGMDSGGFGVGTVGTKLHIENILTIDYEIKALSDVGEGDIDWALSATALDLGVSDLHGSHQHSRLKSTFTVTNRGALPFELEAKMDVSDSSWEAVQYLFGDVEIKTTPYFGDTVAPGGTAEITVSTESHGNWATTGTVEGCRLLLTAYYPDSREENTLTASIPVTAKFLYEGGHIIENKGIDRSGTVRAFDAQGGELTMDGSILVAKEGSAVTFTVTPHSPADFHVSQFLVDDVSVGAVNRYTLTNIRSSHIVDFALAPGAAPAAQQPQQPITGAAQPAAWAAPLVDQAKALGILPAELQSAYDQPITRREFCTLADGLYTAVKESPAPADAAVTFTDTTDAAVLRMASAKVVNGVGEGKFDPDGQLTREQAATMLSRLSAALGKPLTAGTATFDDNASISSWASEAVGQMQASGVMGGTGGNLFSPQMTYSREQSIVTLMRLYGMVK